MNDGGQAFPRAGDELADAVDGMSLRDWFAGQALAGILSNRCNHASDGLAANWSYVIADAMLAERAKERDEADD